MCFPLASREDATGALSVQVEALCSDNRRVEGLRAAAQEAAAAAMTDQAAVARNLDAAIAREAAARFEETKAKDEVQTLTIYIKGQVCMRTQVLITPAIQLNSTLPPESVRVSGHLSA